MALDPSTVPAKTRIASESDTGPAAAVIRMVSPSGKRASLDLSAVSGDSLASILIEVSPDGQGGVGLSAQAFNADGEELSLRYDNVLISTNSFHLAAQAAGGILDELNLIISRTAKLSIGALTLAAKSMLIAAERKLVLKARELEIRTSGGTVKAEASRIELNAPQGQLGQAGLPIVTQQFPPFVIDSHGVVCKVQGLAKARWRAE